MTVENSIVDYAMPLMVIEKLAKEVHNKCLKHQYKEAQELALKLGAEARLLQATLVIMEERQR